MAATAMVHVRVNEEIKAQAAETLEAMGLSVSDAVRMMLVRISVEKKLPFEARIPNATTVKALEDSRQKKGKRFKTPEALFESWSK